MARVPRVRPRPGKYDAGIKVLAIQYLREGKTIDQTRRLLKSPVSPRTISRWHSLYRRTACVVRNPDEYEALGRNVIMTDEDRDFMLELLDGNPGLYLEEYRHSVYRRTGTWISIATIARDIKDRLHLTLKTARTVHPLQSPSKRARFLHTLGGLNPNMLVFLDECAIQERFLKRKFGRALRGHRTERIPTTRGGKRFSLLPAIFKGGLLAVDCQEGSYLRCDFEGFLKHRLFPLMNPYPQANSVLVMDNARIHHGGRIKELAEERGIRIIYLPPYSPDLNPIEKAFSILKSYFRRTQCLHQAPADEKIDVIIDTTWHIFTGALMHRLYAVCGYWL